MRALVLLSFLLVACADAADSAPEASGVSPSPQTTEAAPETDSAAPEASGVTAASAQDAAADPDLTTAAGLLEAFQAAAASGDAAAFEPFLELDSDDRETFDEYIATSLLSGGDAHDLLMGLTEADLEPAEGGAYTTMLSMNTEHDGEIYESAIILRLAPLGEEYRIVSAQIAG